MEYNGGQMNVYGMGQIVNDPQAREIGNSRRVQVELIAYPHEEAGKWKRAPFRIDLRLRDGQSVPTKGQVIVVNSGVYGIDEREKDGETKYYHNSLAFSWRVLDTSTQTPTITKRTEQPVEGAQVGDVREATPPPEPPGDEKVSVPF